jgi:hypothetical protein
LTKCQVRLDAAILAQLDKHAAAAEGSPRRLNGGLLLRRGHAKVPDGAFDLGVPEQELHGAQITGTPVNQSRLGPS